MLGSSVGSRSTVTGWAQKMKNTIRSFIFLSSLLALAHPLHAQWIPMNDLGLATAHLDVSGPNLVAGAFGGIFVSFNGGVTWSRSNIFGADSSVTAITVGSNGAGGTKLFASSFGPRVFLSTDNSTNWSVAGVLPIPYNQSPTSLAMSARSLFAGTRSGIYRSTDDGVTWTPVNNGLMTGGGLSIGTLAVSGANLFAGTGQGPFLSTDDGTKWTQVTSGLSTSAAVITLFGSGTTVLAATNGAGVFRSTDNGTSWSKSNTTSGGVVLPSVDKFVAYGTRMFAAFSQFGVWMSVDSGANWAPVNTGLPNVTVNVLAVYGTNLYTVAGTTLCRRPLSELMTSVKEPSIDVPRHFGLEQNYPNPFNPSTTISFSLPSRSTVSLKIFDALGREVAMLLAEELAGGTYSRQWNAAGLPSGVYFYRLQAGSFIETKRLILQK
jgi:hypothetical protein